MKTVFLGLGANLGDRRATLHRAIAALEHPGLRVTRVSPVYETEPLGFREQDWFLNLVVEAQTDLSPEALLARIRTLETAFGRVRSIPNGPRTLDIDILLFGADVISTSELEVPHPRYRERRFVLAPLCDLAPDLRDPVTGVTVRDLLARLSGQAARPVSSRPTS